MKHKFMGIICMLTLSCQNIQPNIQQVKNIPESNKLKSFNKKAFDLSIVKDVKGSFRNDDLGVNYVGPEGPLINNIQNETNKTDYANDISGGFSARLSQSQDLFLKTIDQNIITNTNVNVIGNVSPITDNNSRMGRYLELNDTKTELESSQPSTRLIYNPPVNSGVGSFSSIGSGSYASNGEPIFIENNGVSVNYNTISNLSYNGVSRLNGSLPSNWKEKSNYSYSYDKSSNITFDFYGTNVEIFGNKGINTIWNDIKISLYKESTPNNFNVLVSEVIGLTNDTINQTGSVYKFKALPMKKYKVKLESKSSSKSTGKVSFLYGFDKACVYPSIEYTFDNDSIKNAVYETATYNTAGQVEITVDNSINSQIVNIGSASPKSNFITEEKYTYVDRDIDTKKQHVLTIESLGKPSTNPVTTGTEISLSTFKRLPEISSTFLRKNLPLSLMREPKYGKVDLYANDKFIKTIDLYSPTKNYILDLTQDASFSEDYNTFKLVSSSDLNPSTRRIVTFDTFIRDNHRAEFNFVTLNTGYITYICSKGNDRGKVKSRLFNVNNPSNPILQDAETSLDLYDSGKYYGDDRRLHSLKYDNIPAGRYKLLIEPTFEKNPNSLDYLIDISEVKFISNVSSSGNANPNNFDSVCTP